MAEVTDVEHADPTIVETLREHGERLDKIETRQTIFEEQRTRFEERVEHRIDGLYALGLRILGGIVVAIVSALASPFIAQLVAHWGGAGK